MVRFPGSWDESYRPEPENDRYRARSRSAPVRREADRAEDKTDRIARTMEARETPRQQELARCIYARLKAGAEVDDVRNLITEMGRTMAEESRAPGWFGPSAGGKA